MRIVLSGMYPCLLLGAYFQDISGVLNSNRNCALWYTLRGQGALRDTPAGDEDLKGLPHAGRCDEMFQLKGDFGTLLGRLAVFEYVGEMICFAHVHQKLCLRAHGLHMHTLSAGRRGEKFT